MRGGGVNLAIKSLWLLGKVTGFCFCCEPPYGLCKFHQMYKCNNLIKMGTWEKRAEKCYSFYLIRQFSIIRHCCWSASQPCLVEGAADCKLVDQTDHTPICKPPVSEAVKKKCSTLSFFLQWPVLTVRLSFPSMYKIMKKPKKTNKNKILCNPKTS